MSYDKKNIITDQKLKKVHVNKLVLLIAGLILLVINIIVAASNARVASSFWGNANAVTTTSTSHFNSVWTTFVLYFFIYLGIAAIGIMILLGLSGLEGGYIKMLYRRKIESLPPEEDNWEYNKTTKRHEEEKKCINKVRAYSAIELVVVLVAAVGGYWTLWLADVDQWNIPELYTAMIVELAIVAIWALILSPFFQYKREKKFYFKDPHQNWKTLEFEERGLGSWKTYYREDRKKHNKLMAYLIYFNILGLWGLAWNNGGGENIVGGVIFNALGIAETAVVPTMIIFYLAWNILFLVYTGLITIYNNSTEGKIYKVLLFLVIFFFTLGTIGLLNAFETEIMYYNWASMDFILGMVTVVVLFGLFVFLLYFFVLPIAVRLDNFEVVKKDIAVIMISTIVFMSIFAAFFDFFLPMADASGTPFQHGYPYLSGLDEDASYLWNNFAFPIYLIGWYGYVWWGFVQQFLFMSYFLRLLYRIFPKSEGFLPAGFSSLIFGIIHYPDWPLMLFTGVAGLMWAYFWQKKYINKDGKEVRGNNLYIWGMIHGFGGTFVSQLIPISMSVGPFNV
jgi:hypothetical protein